MEAQSVQARIEQGTAQLRALFPQITECHTALVQWREGQSVRYSLHLDIRWPQHQTLLNGAACDSAEAAIEAGLRSADERLTALVTTVTRRRAASTIAQTSETKPKEEFPE